MPENMGYMVVEASNEESLMEHVNSFLIDGWRLQGGIAVNTTEEREFEILVDVTRFYQAMYKP